jgi:hypothetical protein
MRFRVWLVILSLAGAAHQAAADELGDCLTTAMTNYNKARLARAVPQGSVENTIAMRRLEEHYCLQIAQCEVASYKDRVSAALFPMVLDASFSACLRGEALEQYDAVPRK